MSFPHENEFNLDEEDLIDFQVGSPEFLASILGADCTQDVPETLLDTELLHLEQTLKISTNTPIQRSRSNSKDSVELEQVLITIDDEESTKRDGENESLENGDILENCSEKYSFGKEIYENIPNDSICHFSTNSHDNSTPKTGEGSYDETLIVLNELDKILSVHDVSDLGEEPKTPNEEEQRSVDECLRDLDDYLQSFDVTSTKDYPSSLDLIAEQNDVLKDNELRQRLRKLVARSASLSRNGKLQNHEPENRISADWRTLARNHRFRATISALRRELRPNHREIDKQNCDKQSLLSNFNNSTESFNSIDSKCHILTKNNAPNGESKHKLLRNHHLRATIGALNHNNPADKVMRPNYLTLNTRKAVSADWKPLVREHCLRNTVGSLRRDRKSGDIAHVVDSDEEIDWSWVQEVNACAIQPTGNEQEVSVSAPSAVVTDGLGKLTTQLQKEDTNLPLNEENIEVDKLNTDTISNEEATFSTMNEQNNTLGVNKNLSEPEIPSSSWLRSSMRRITSLSVGNASGLPQELDKTLERPSSSSWLRSSMRRIRHFRLPSDPSPTETQVTVITSTIPPQIEPVTPVVLQPRPFSAPVRISSDVTVNLSVPAEVRIGVSEESVGRALPRSSSESSRSRRARSLSSSESSLASSVDSIPGCTPVAPTTIPAVVNGDNATTNVRRPCDRPSQPQMPEVKSPLGQWPHSLSSMLATMGCTLGLFNVCRFATLSIQFGANFIIQFLILSFLFGIPLFTLQLCLGQQLGAGVIDMWRISPLFQGVGVALLISQAMLGIYSVVGVSWMFIYFRDSFITKMDVYRWAQVYEYYRDDSKSFMNNTSKISETVPDYLSGVVLQRHNLVSGNSFGAIKFQVAFNLAVVWMIVFVSLSKGLRSYAKVVYVFSLLPIFGTFVLCAKLLGMTPSDSLHEVFPETSWGEFFLNTKSWLAASQEAFLTWGLLGAAVMQLASHNKHRHLLQRDSSLVIILTITILMLTAFLANTCIEILHFYGYNYLPNSFERISSYVFLRPTKEPLPPSLATTPVRYMTHSSFVIGERVVRPGMDRSTESGYQVLRFATELVPATLAILGPNQISPFWAVLFYFILILFGIAQQLAIWHCVITGIMAIKSKVLKSWETTITFFSCTFGFILGLPMTTEMGIYVVYFLDYCVGGIWWLVLVYLLQVVAVFMVRGRPYSGDTVVTALFTSASSACALTWLAPLLSFTWNVILPVALMVVCITVFRTGNFRELFIWHHALSLDYWPTWTRQLGSLIQLAPILCIPVVALIQSYRYLNNGPPDILDRIQLLYRPPMNSEHLDDTVAQQTAATNNNATVATVTIPAEDPPPKYTPPPSYTTATGARIAKLLRQSIRRSVRRIASVLGESSFSRTETNRNSQLPPPDYSAVLVEMNQSTSGNNATRIGLESRTSRELSNFQGSTLTAADVASILRSSFRGSTIRTLRRNQHVSNETPSGSLSNQNLVDGVSPLGMDSLFLGNISLNSNDENKSTNVDNSSSVI